MKILGLGYYPRVIYNLLFSTCKGLLEDTPYTFKRLLPVVLYLPMQWQCDTSLQVLGPPSFTLSCLVGRLNHCFLVVRSLYNTVCVRGSTSDLGTKDKEEPMCRSHMQNREGGDVNSPRYTDLRSVVLHLLTLHTLKIRIRIFEEYIHGSTKKGKISGPHFYWGSCWNHDT